MVKKLSQIACTMALNIFSILKVVWHVCRWLTALLPLNSPKQIFGSYNAVHGSESCQFLSYGMTRVASCSAHEYQMRYIRVLFHKILYFLFQNTSNLTQETSGNGVLTIWSSLLGGLVDCLSGPPQNACQRKLPGPVKFIFLVKDGPRWNMICSFGLNLSLYPT